MENYSGQVLTRPPVKTFFGITLESSSHFLIEDENKDTKIVHASMGTE